MEKQLYYLVFVKPENVQENTLNEHIKKRWGYYKHNHMSGVCLPTMLHTLINADVWEGDKGLPYIFNFTDASGNIKILNNIDPDDW